jgi:hypothetical protein
MGVRIHTAQVRSWSRRSSANSVHHCRADHRGYVSTIWSKVVAVNDESRAASRWNRLLEANTAAAQHTQC